MMIGRELRERRQRIGLSQADVAALLQIGRGAIMAMEAASEPVPRSVEIAMTHLIERRWWQRPEVGPVTLVYADGPLFLGQGNYRVPMLQCEPFLTNAEAVTRACELYERGRFFNPLVTADGGQRVLFNSMELAKAYERKQDGKPPLSAHWPPTNGDEEW